MLLLGEFEKEIAPTTGAAVGDHVETLITIVWEGSTTGSPKTTEVEEFIVVDPLAIDS
jgi:hypothetical protein